MRIIPEPIAENIVSARCPQTPMLLAAFHRFCHVLPRTVAVLATPSARPRWCIAALAVTLWCAAVVSAQSTQPDFERRLAAAHHSSFSGRSLRESLDALGQATDVVYWLDRRVDPSQIANVPLAGPSVEAAFSRTAASVGLVSLPIDNLILVGRADWVDHTGSLILAASSRAQPGAIDGQPGKPADELSREPLLAVEWPLLSTPQEALELVAEQRGWDATDVSLPHDLWPAFACDSIRATTLLTLIGSEFDLWLRVDETKKISSQPLPEKMAIEKSYSTALVESMKAEIEKVHPQTQLLADGNQISVRGGARVHRLLTVKTRAASRPAPPAAARPAAGVARFSIQWQNAPAGKALETLAQAGGWTLVVDPPAAQRGLRRIQVNAQDMPLTELVEKVCEQAELSASWEGKTLTVRLP